MRKKDCNNMLMGKPLLKQIKAFQDYRSDSIMVHMNDTVSNKTVPMLHTFGMIGEYWQNH